MTAQSERSVKYTYKIKSEKVSKLKEVKKRTKMKTQTTTLSYIYRFEFKIVVCKKILSPPVPFYLFK